MNTERSKLIHLVVLGVLTALLLAPSAVQAGRAESLPADLEEAIRVTLEADGAIVPQALGGLQEAKLVPSDIAAGDLYGYAVAMYGDTALVGAADADLGDQADAGAAYVFVRSGGVWSQQAKLTASDAAAGDEFGWSVALSGDTALIGAPGADIGDDADAGAAYVFTRSGTTWSQQAKLTEQPSNASALFGSAVALDGNTALVGAPGEKDFTGIAQVFVRSGTAWSWQAELTGSDTGSGDFFGTSTALSGNTALIGASGADIDTQADAGAAYVFTRSDSTWSQQAKLTAADAAGGDSLGGSVALSGDTALIGAATVDVGGQADAGAVYVFTRSDSTWSQQAKLTAADATAGDRFGRTVALDDDVILVGARGVDAGAQANSGAAYVFSYSGTAWEQQAEFTASDTAAGDWFGYVALSKNVALVGAPLADVGTEADSGAAYAFLLLPDRLVNGSMETDANADKVPDGWKIKSPSGKSARKCDNPAKDKYYAYLGNCAVVLQSTGAKEVLQQTYTPAGGGLAGDLYTLMLWAKGKSIPAGATARAVVQFAYTDATKEKFILDLPTGDYAYQQFTLDVAASKDYSSVKVKIEYTASGGKLYVDDVSLLQTN